MATQIRVWINKIRLGVEDPEKAKIYNRDSSQYCVKNGFVAIGYSINNINEDTTWEAYEESARKNYKDDFNVIKSFHDDPKKGDLCWARTEEGVYYLGKLHDGIWHYKTDTGFDIHNAKECDWVEIGEELDNIPSEVIMKFGPGKYKYMISAEKQETKILSAHLWVEKHKEDAGEYQYDLKNIDITGLLSTYDYEDIIGIYLQKRYNYYMIASTRGPNTQKYEYELVKNGDGKLNRAFCQVKTGGAGINLEDYKEQNEYYLFSDEENYYTGKEKLDNKKLDTFLKENKNLHIIEKQELIDFMNKNKDILPKRVAAFLDLCLSYKKE